MITPNNDTANAQVLPSDFSYEPYQADDGGDLKGDFDSFLKTLDGESEPEAPVEDDSLVDPDPEVEPSESDTEGSAPQQTDGATEDDDEEDPKIARSVQRVLAREMAAREREQAAEKRIAELKAMEVEYSKYKDLKPTKDLAEQMALDPVGAIKALGHDPSLIVKLALAQELEAAGEEVPAKLKEFTRDIAMKREVAQLRAQVQQQEQARAAQEYFNTVQNGAREYVQKVGAKTPTLAMAAKADPDYVRDEIMEEIVTEARKQAAQDPNGELISYEEAASRVEKRLARIAKLFSVQNGTTPATKNVTQPNRTMPPAAKPAAKPRAPWMRQENSLEEQGLQEALRVYERAEAARKASRK